MENPTEAVPTSPALNTKQSTKMYIHGMKGRLKESQAKSPAFSPDVFRQLFPNYAETVSAEDDIKLQRAGVDIILKDKDGNVIATIDKKERFPRHDKDLSSLGKSKLKNKPVTQIGEGFAYKDIAVELLTIAMKDVPEKDLDRKRDWFAPHDFLRDTLNKVFIPTLAKTKSLAAALAAAKEHGAKAGYTIGPGWASKPRSQRTVDATMYAIAPLGVGYLIDEATLQKVLESHLPTLYRTKSKELSEMRPTISYDKVTGRKWGVINVGLTVDWLRKQMALPDFNFPTYGRVVSKKENQHKDDTTLGRAVAETGTTKKPGLRPPVGRQQNPVRDRT